MKKFFRKGAKLLALTASLLLAMNLASCGGGDDDDDEETPENGTPTTVVDTTKEETCAPESAGAITMDGVSYSTIQAALDAISDSGTHEIKLGAGTYEESGLHYNGSATVVISGQGTASHGLDVLIKGVGQDMTDSGNGPAEKKRELLEIQGSCNLILENLTLQNTFTADGNRQAEAFGFDSTGTVAAYNCSFLSGQDTVRTISKAWFYKCYFEGDVDFLWMERDGVVALYEECKIISVDLGKDAYVAAPGLDASKTQVGKGLVIFNSSVANGGSKSLYLTRTPWSSGRFNQVAYINTKTSGINSAVWYKSQIATDYPKTVVGWKMDKATASVLDYSGNSDILSDTDVSNEYSGRDAILNRLYDLESGKWIKDSASYWNVGELETKWNATADTSSALLSGETEVASATYDIANLALAASNMTASDSNEGTVLTDGSSSDEILTWKNLKAAKVAYGTMTQNTTEITIKVSEASVITWTGSSYANGTITVKDSSENIIVSAASTKTSSDKISEGFLYTGTSATTLTLSFTGTTYINNIIVKTLSDEVNKPSSISVSFAEAQIAKSETTTASATVVTKYLNAYTPSFTWTSSNTSVATVNSSTGAISGVAAGTSDITATCDGVSGNATLTVTATATSIIAKAVWDWTTAGVTFYADSAMATEIGSGATGGIQSSATNKTAYLKGTSDKLLMYADASTGKLGYNAAYAQINEGTKIQIPVSAGSVVTVVAYGGQAKWTVGGVSQTTNTAVMTAPSAGYIELVATNTGYINAIQVTNVDYEEAHTTPVTVSAFDSTSSSTTCPE